MKIRNVTSDILVVAGIPAILPQEEREVSKEEWEVLLRNPFIEEIKTKTKAKVK